MLLRGLGVILLLWEELKLILQKANLKAAGKKKQVLEEKKRRL